MLRIIEGDFSDRRVIELLETHVMLAHGASPPGTAYALDLEGLKAPGIGFWTVWHSDRQRGNGKDAEEELAGCGALKRLSPTHGEIKSMHTVAHLRGLGIASTMLGHIVEKAKASGMTRLSLETGTQHYFASARALYARHGFTPCEPFGDYKAGPHNTFMSREI
ncbi:putative acetyltransferase [Parvibaculum indicum]|uniref:GNAT family N-acetyltransferase n=1 Tax=Parvibaculum indicum TaxID=562969 RepID=UPI001FE70AB9|nr:GNAT family N-acetyltransferase [Parvibaculum indicum]NIJ42361.1 putative acetyltransferase [Parvibaculum indicum]